MARVALSRLFSAAWIMLLSGGCAGGLAFLALATALDRAEHWADKYEPRK